VLTLVGLGTAGCGNLYLLRDPAIRGGEVAIAPPSPRARATGSLWRDNVAANYIAADVRARFPGDLITILIVEDASGLKEAETSTQTETDVSGSLEEFFGLPQQLQKKNPDINPSQLIKANAAREWDGKGSTSRKGRLSARMTAQVTAVAPNGNLKVQGEKIIAINQEDQHLVVEGWVRPEDITAQNEVLSTRLASARIEYYGVGPVGVKQRPGWGLWILDRVWPF
jgi:flagellar L-ring protein precursor FlgH